MRCCSFLSLLFGFFFLLGVHLLQVKHGCEWDNETGDVSGFSLCGYDGEDLISLNLKDSTWTALTPQAVLIKQKWDTDKDAIRSHQRFLTEICPAWLKMYLKYENGSLRTGRVT